MPTTLVTQNGKGKRVKTFAVLLLSRLTYERLDSRAYSSRLLPFNSLPTTLVTQNSPVMPQTRLFTLVRKSKRLLRT
jgi:hypothetical protein